MQFPSVCSEFLSEHGAFLARIGADGRRPGCAASNKTLELCVSVCQMESTFTVQHMFNRHLQQTKHKWHFPFQVLAKATL